MNCWWDARLRRDYSQWLLIGVIAVALLILVICSVDGLTADKMVVFAAMVLPAITLGITQHSDFRDSAEKCDKVVKMVDDALKKAATHASVPDLTKEARTIQDEIYDLRRAGPMVFDFVYRRSREEDQKLATAAAQHLVEEAAKAWDNDLIVRTSSIRQQLQSRLDAFTKHLRDGSAIDPSFAAAANDLLTRMLDEADGLAKLSVKYEVQRDNNVLFRSLTEAGQVVRAVFCASEMNVVRLWTRHPMDKYLKTSGNAAARCPEGFTRLFVFPHNFNLANDADVATCVAVLDDQDKHKIDVYLHFTMREAAWEAWGKDLVVVDDRRVHIYVPAKKLANDYWWTTADLSVDPEEVRRRINQFEKGKLEALSWREQRDECISRLRSFIPVDAPTSKPKTRRRLPAQPNAGNGNGNAIPTANGNGNVSGNGNANGNANGSGNPNGNATDATGGNPTAIGQPEA
jgi:hypothetical protein